MVPTFRSADDPYDTLRFGSLFPIAPHIITFLVRHNRLVQLLCTKFWLVGLITSAGHLRCSFARPTIHFCHHRRRYVKLFLGLFSEIVIPEILISFLFTMRVDWYVKGLNHAAFVRVTLGLRPGSAIFMRNQSPCTIWAYFESPYADDSAPLFRLILI